MKILTDKQLQKIKFLAKVDVFKDVTKKKTKDVDVIEKIIAEQLDRVERDIGKWRDNVESAEDLDNPDRLELMEMFRDFVDDSQLYSTMETRILKSISGSFKIVDEKGEKDEIQSLKFINPVGYPHKWFQDFMKFVMDSVFYGFEAIQLGDIENDIFTDVEKVPEENLIPYYDSMIKNVNIMFTKDGDNIIFFGEDPIDTWVVRTGSKTDLGLINKCAPYVIWKNVFGAWSQHASIFGMPLRVGSTDLADNQRRQNLINAFEEMTGASYIIKDALDEIDLIERKGSSDPNRIYGALIEKCDQAISKIILGQTGTTDEKAYSGSADVHNSVLDSIIFADKINIMTVVNDQLIPRMQKIGIIPSGKKYFGVWDFSEELTIKEWAEVILKLSQSGYVVPAEEVTKKTGVEVDEEIIAVPENKNISVMNKINKLYGQNNS
jgi:phage gp29-like protein